MIHTFTSLMRGRSINRSDRRITPIVMGMTFFWAAILLVALVAGLILANENLTQAVLLFAALGGVLLLCLPLEWLFVGMLVSTWVIAPSMGYFLGITQSTYVAPALAIVVGAKIFLIAALNRVQRRQAIKAPRQSAAILWTIYGYFLTIAISILVNQPPANQTLMALKFYLPFWSAFFAIGFGFISTNFVIQIWRWLVPLALLQLPFTVYQHFIIVPKRPDFGLVNAFDCVVGTFGGDPMAGGNNATIMTFLITGMVVAVASNRCGRITRRAMLIALMGSFISLMMGETKAAFVLLPIALIVFDLRLILARPARLLGIVLVFGPALFGMYRAYQIFYNTEAGSSMGYMVNPSEYNLISGEVGRVASLTIWWTDPQADLRRRLVGYGPGSTRSGTLISDGVIAKRYRPLAIAPNTAALLLWDIGVVGTGAFAAILISSCFLGLRQLPLDQSDEERQLIGVATAVATVLLITIVYVNSIVTDGSLALLFMLSAGTIHTFSARLIPERQRHDSAHRSGAAVWGVLRPRKRDSSYPAIRMKTRTPVRAAEQEHPRLSASSGSIREKSPPDATPALDGGTSAPKAAGNTMIGHTFWATLSTWGTRATTFLVFAILTRLLPPDAIGLLAFVNVAYSQVTLLTTCFAESLMWHRDATVQEESTIFWFQLLISIAAALVLGWVGYSWGATLLNHPDASSIIALFACSIPFAAASSIPSVLLRRNLAFKQMAFRSLISTIVGGTVGVALAFEGYGVWSLIWKQLAEAAALFFINFISARWTPRFIFKPIGLGPALRYGAGAAANWTVGSLTGRIDSLIIGPSLGTAVLGVYSVGQRPFWMLWDLLNGVVMSVAYPHLAALSRDRPALTELHRNLIRITTLISAPAFAALGALAPQLIPLVFGPQWDGSPAVLQVFCLSGVMAGVAIFNQDVLMASGKVGTALKLNIAGLLFTTIFVYVGSQYGILYVAAGIVLESLITLPIGLRLARQVSYLGLRQALRSGMPGLFAAVCVYAAIAVTDSSLETESRILRLIITSAAGGFSLLAAWRICAPDFLGLITHPLHQLVRRR